MSITRETVNEAIKVADKYLACEKRVLHCMGGCSKCKYDYHPKDLREAVSILAQYAKTWETIAMAEEGEA